MISETLVRNLLLVWRTERVIADIKLKHMIGRIGLRALATLAAAFGITMLEFAAYLFLVQSWNAITAAVALGVANFTFAATILFVASRSYPALELELANDVQKEAVRSLGNEAYSDFARHPLAMFLPVVLPALVTFIAERRKKNREKSDPSAE